MGHMAEAEAEAIAVYPDVAETLRQARKKMEMEPEWMPVLLPVISEISKRLRLTNAKQSCDGACGIGDNMNREERIASNVAREFVAAGDSVENILLAGIKPFYQKVAGHLRATIDIQDQYSAMLTWEPKNSEAKEKGLFFDMFLKLDIRKHGQVNITVDLIGNSEGDAGIWNKGNKTDIGPFVTAAQAASWAAGKAQDIEREFLKDPDLWKD